ncbi:MAG: uracil-DNA glycosylase [Chloroflexi bacterium]|nr:uracil-DNA glycosylase [Chloroflexota bacterium]
MIDPAGQQVVTELEALNKQMTGCAACGLAKGRTQVVPGEGNPHAEVVFIGEGPGFHEDQQGRPFVGPAGQFLDELLKAAGLRRSEVYICNIVKCRPPGNRDPYPIEIQTCSKWLDSQLALVHPKVIVTLGRYSLARYLPGQSISKVHGKPLVKDGVTIVPMLHPAAALHQASLRPTLLEDFAQLPQILKAARAAPTPAGAAAGTQQLTLF